MSFEPVSSYSTIVRQLDSSPSQARRYSTLNGRATGRKPSNSIKSDSFDANSTYDSCQTESCNKSEYSNSYYSQAKHFHTQNNFDANNQSTQIST